MRISCGSDENKVENFALFIEIHTTACKKGNTNSGYLWGVQLKDLSTSIIKLILNNFKGFQILVFRNANDIPRFIETSLQFEHHRIFPIAIKEEDVRWNTKKSRIVPTIFPASSSMTLWNVFKYHNSVLAIARNPF